MNIVLTGSHGFLGKNLQIHLRSIKDFNLINISKETDFEKIDEKLKIDLILHFGGVNRSEDKSDFIEGNVDFTRKLLAYATKLQSPPVVIFSSSLQSNNGSDYGESKHEAEKLVHDYGNRVKVEVNILKLPNIFGKWAKPFHNSVVATFAMQISQGLPLNLFNESQEIPFIYVDDLCEILISQIRRRNYQINFDHLIQKLTPMEIANRFSYFHTCLKQGLLPKISGKLDSNLYATYVSQLESSLWVKELTPNFDSRGSFVEVFKIEDSFQISLLKILAGQTRGEHLHNSKIERFFVVSGDLEFSFRHPFEEKLFSVQGSGSFNNLIEAIPGWWHSIKNIGTNEAVILVWASEIFDPVHPDTYRWEWK